MYILMGVWNY